MCSSERKGPHEYNGEFVKHNGQYDQMTKRSSSQCYHLGLSRDNVTTWKNSNNKPLE